MKQIGHHYQFGVWLYMMFVRTNFRSVCRAEILERLGGAYVQTNVNKAECSEYFDSK